MPVFVLPAALVAWPWLWPFTSGPTAVTQPYLVALAAAALLLALWPRARADGVRAATAGWLAAALLSAAIALLQYFRLEAPLHPWVNLSGAGRAFGNLRQPNQLATLLMIGVLALRAGGQQALVAPRHAAWMGALLVTALAATVSRAGLVELLVAAVLVLWWGRGERRAWWPVGGLLAVYALAALGLPLLVQAGSGSAGHDVLARLQVDQSRLVLWRNVLHLIALEPWTGWGWGELDYAHYITLYEGARFAPILDNAHNLPLHLAVELGVPLALLAFGALAWAVWRGRPWAEPDPGRQLAWGVLAMIGIHSLVEYPLWYGPFQIAAVLCAWLLWPAGVGAVLPAGGRPAVAGLVLAAVAYAGWDYHRISQLYLPREQRAAAYRADAMGEARKSWLYADAVRFAEVTTRPATRANAAWLLPEALRTLHYSPEPRVIVQVIESATLLGREDLALAHLARFRAAFPREYRQWTQDNRRVREGARELLRPSASAAGVDS